MSQTHDQQTRPLPALPPPASPPPGHGPAPGRTPSGSPPTRHPRTVALAAGAVALAAVVGVAGLLHTTGSENEYQTVSYAGANPFTAPVGTDQPGLTSLPRGGDRPATSPEMYQQDPGRPACDADALRAQLQNDQVKAAAWSRVERVAPGALPRYLQSLTPVVLRADTAVVDHGYRDGTFVPTPAVLAAGTAVFLNSYGQPTVKCYSGDPLTPGTSTDATVTTVVAAPTPITTHTFHHPTGGTPVTRAGKPDTTGTGPAPKPAPTTDGGTGSPAPTTPAPTTPAPTTPVTGYFLYDGSIMLSDGRLQKPDGSVVTFPKRDLATTTGLPDGGWRDKNGLYYNQDGSRRDLVEILNGGFFVTPDGTIVNRANQEVPLRPNAYVVRHHDGSVTVFEPDATGDHVSWQTTTRAGTTGPILSGSYENGVLRNTQGKVINVDGSERRAATLPGGGRIEPSGENVPAPPKPTPGPTTAPGTDQPRNSGIVPPKYRTPAAPTTTVPIERGPAKNTGIVPPGSGSSRDGAGDPATSEQPGGTTG